MTDQDLKAIRERWPNPPADVVPAKALIEAGWWFECYGCYRRVREDVRDDDDDEGHPLDGPIYRGNRGVWCSTKCQADHDWRRAQEKAADDAGRD